jgi:hypothetical protein
MRFFKNNEKSTLGFRLALSSSDFSTLVFFFGLFSFFFLGRLKAFFSHTFLISYKGAYFQGLISRFKVATFWPLGRLDQILGWFNWPILDTL